MISRFFSASLIIASLSVAVVSSSAFGQAEGGGAEEEAGPPGNWEAGLHLGTLLPNQIGGVSEIMGLGGVRVGNRIAQRGWLEGGFLTGNESGQKWRNIHGGVRMDIPVENLIGIAGVGLDIVQYSGPGRSSTINFGGHLNLGIQAALGGNILLRTDMKFGFSPGTQLYIGFGLVWRFGEGGAGGAN